MKAFRVVDCDLPGDADTFVVFAEDEAGAVALYNELGPIGYVEVSRREAWDAHIPPEVSAPVVCDDPAVMLRCGVIPYGYLECESCGELGRWPESCLCPECDAAREVE